MTSPPRAGLGRQFAGHDDRSRGYGVRPLLPRGIRQPTFWPLPEGPYPLDQGGEGACTGYGLAHELAAGPIVVPGVDNGYALHRYRRNQEMDRAEGNNFTDGATVRSTMKAAKADGVITGYRWCFGADDVIDTVCTVGPVCLGIDWYAGMYATRTDGLVKISGQRVGGHFITIIGYDVHPRGGACVLWINTWGLGYGVADQRLRAPGGVGWLRTENLAFLLASDGEAVVPADYFPAPVPEPPPPPPPPAPPQRWPWLPSWLRW
jgi:hypothetical protein